MDAKLVIEQINGDIHNVISNYVDLKKSGSRHSS